MNPFLVLDVPADAGDEDVRAAYRDLLRRFPPEREPERFQQIQDAYELLRTAEDRWRWRLLHLEDDPSGPLAALEAFARLPGRMRPPGAKAFRGLLRGCSQEAGRQSACRKRKR